MRAQRFRAAIPGCALIWMVAALAAGSPKAQELSSKGDSLSLLGSYMAGRHARSQHETTDAAEFYRQALGRDPDNEVILEQAFQMEAAEGNWPQATELAKRLLQIQPANRAAHTWLGILDFKNRNFDAADERLRNMGPGMIGEITSLLARAWMKLGQGDSAAALALLDGAKPAEWPTAYLRYHRALIADLAGRRAEARRAFDQIFKAEPRTTRTVLAYARSVANAGDLKQARAVVKEHLDKAAGDGHPMVRALRDQLQTTEPVQLLVQTPDQGMAEVFYGLGEALAGEGGVSLGAIYLQVALFLDGSNPSILAALANVYEVTRRFERAIEIYNRMPANSALSLSIQIRKALDLNQLERVEDAKELLEQLAAAYPAEIAPLDALGTIMRARKRYAEAVDYYTRAITLIPKPEKRHWSYWYARGTCYERVKKWPLAEADLQKALQLYPDQPLILNYLGYSWIDQNRKLREGMAMIEKAVQLKPDDGYIVDSLGWAHYKLENYKDAVKHLERAVELRPEDPVLNDHLGDALWRIGRRREAAFQWEQSLTLNPEPEDVDKIRDKVRNGLPERPIAKGAKKTKEASRTTTSKKRAETQLPLLPFPF